MAATVTRGPLRWHHWLPRKRYFLAGKVGAADEVPGHLPRKAAIVVVNREQRTWVAFDCPCSGRHRLMINLDPRRRPSWKLDSTNAITLSPSVDVRSDERCHFWMRAGRVQWVPAQQT